MWLILSWPSQLNSPPIPRSSSLRRLLCQTTLTLRFSPDRRWQVATSRAPSSELLVVPHWEPRKRGELHNDIMQIRPPWNEDTSKNGTHFVVPALCLHVQSWHIETLSSVPRMSGLETFHCVLCMVLTTKKHIITHPGNWPHDWISSFARILK